MDELAARPFDYAAFKVPTLHMSGWFDYIYPNTIGAYENILRHSPEAGPQKLQIGMWPHNDILRGTTTAGDETFRILSPPCTPVDAHHRPRQATPICYFRRIPHGRGRQVGTCREHGRTGQYSDPISRESRASSRCLDPLQPHFYHEDGVVHL